MTRTAALSLSALLAACLDFSLPKASNQIRELDVEPPVARRGTEVHVTVGGTFLQAPQVKLLGQLLSQVSTNEFTYTTTGSEPEGVDLAVEATVGDANRSATLRFDFTAPRVASLSPARRSVTPGQALSFDLVASEALSEAPGVTVAGRSGACVGKGAAWSCSVTPGGSDPSGWLTASISLLDLAGNSSQEERGVGVVLDRQQALAVQSFAVDPTRAGRGATLSLTFSVNQLLAAEPTAYLDAGAQHFAATWLSGPDDDGRYEYRLPLLGAELGGLPDQRSARIMLDTGAGSLELGQVFLDFRAPALDASAPAQPLQQIGKGQTAEVLLQADEDLLSLAATVQGNTMACAQGDAPSRWSCSYTALGSEQEGPQQLVVYLTDLVGNADRLLAPVPLRFDFTCKVDATKVFFSGQVGKDWSFVADPGAFDPNAGVELVDRRTNASVSSLTADATGAVAATDLLVADVPDVIVRATDATAPQPCAAVSPRIRYLAAPALPVPGQVATVKAWKWTGGTSAPDLAELTEALTVDLAPIVSADDGSVLTVQADKAAAPDWIAPAEGSPLAALAPPLVYLPGAGVACRDPVHTIVWVWSGSGWSALTASGGPAGSDGSFGMAFDRPRRELVIFGGLFDTTWAAILPDVIADGSTSWAAATTAGPAARTYSPLTFDAVRGETLLFGGYFGDAYGNSLDYGDTWTFDGARWARHVPLLSPTPRDSPAIAFDSRRGRTVLFGGEGLDLVPLGDTWEWTGTEWISRSGASSPARVGGAMAFDAIRGVSVLAGGYDASGPCTDAWTWDGATWTPLTTATPAPVATANDSQYLGAMAYDEARGRLVVFSQLDDRIWELTEAGMAASLIVRLPVYDPGTSPSSLTVTAWAAATVTSQASLYSSLELSLWDSARARWVRVASMATGATGPLTATVSGGDIGRFTSTGSLLVLAAAPPSSTTSESTLSVDYLQAELEW